MKFVSAACFLVFASRAFARTFTVKNNCAFTIWPAVFTDLNVGTSVPNVPTGWEAESGSQVMFDVPDDWTAGRIWARRDCDFSNNNTGPNSCLDGGCNRGLLCDPHTGTGVPPASVAEWTLQGAGNMDFYDTSLVDGFNLALSITNNVGCPVADCPVDLVPNCPTPIQGPFDSSGAAVGCESACQANLDDNQSNSPNCCTGTFSTPATCPSSGVDFYSYFKNNCPNSYVYAFDESSGTALWTCDSGLNADYTLTFCPSNSTTAATTEMSSAPAATSSSPESAKSNHSSMLIKTNLSLIITYILVLLGFGVMIS
ncbi:hypothetical protein PILCRDRAFT_820174 [Piloderma croceum F 1598]|uniref:Thaumatin-like protein n=1 Tax=Piloderma croceum (strain F 1598) TaxID=765440 RepID=A0A0C3FT24_PILCF|nr:hypothetical protein PILCRDRAFT_820174 [Piloderma croceum F 1598]